MRRSSTFFLQTVWLAAVSVLALHGCGSNSPKPTPITSHSAQFDAYYGQPHGDTVQYGNIVVNPTAPQTYVVQKGDTLWGIARKFLNTPWYWPEIWDKNQGIANPHLLYPGDVLTFAYGQGAQGEKLMPRIRVERRGSGEPIATLAAFMLWPRVLDEATIKNAPYILASRDDRELITEGETIYVNNLHHAQVGQRYALFHPNKALHDPYTGQLLGYEVTYGGYSKIERLGNPATGTVIAAKREIHKGDRLFAPVDEIANLNASMHAPNFKVRAGIVSLFDAEHLSGNYMIAVINKGKRDGMQIGHTLGVYADGKYVVDAVQSCNSPGKVCSALPPEKVANLVLYKVTDRVSYGLILDASREVQPNNKIGNP